MYPPPPPRSTKPPLCPPPSGRLNLIKCDHQLQYILKLKISIKQWGRLFFCPIVWKEEKGRKTSFWGSVEDEKNWWLKYKKRSAACLKSTSCNFRTFVLSNDYLFFANLFSQATEHVQHFFHISRGKNYSRILCPTAFFADLFIFHERFLQKWRKVYLTQE